MHIFAREDALSESGPGVHQKVSVQVKLLSHLKSETRSPCYLCGAFGDNIRGAWGLVKECKEISMNSDFLLSH